MKATFIVHISLDVVKVLLLLQLLLLVLKLLIITCVDRVLPSKLSLLRSIFATNTLTRVATRDIILKTFTVVLDAVRAFTSAPFQMLNFPLNFSNLLDFTSIFLLLKCFLSLSFKLSIIHTSTTVALFPTVSTSTETFTIFFQTFRF